MSIYILMKILESAPDRYDKGIHMLTHGRLAKAYDRLITPVKGDQNVLDIGCGTGALTLKAARKGAKVKGIDINPQMLEIAKKRSAGIQLNQNVEFYEMGVAELGSEITESYHVVMSGLCFSELTEDELIYTLKEVKRMLKPGGVLLIADEVVPKNIPKKILHGLIRFPLAILNLLVTQTTTNAIKNLPARIKEEGFLIESVRLNKLESFIELKARKPEKETK